MDERTRRELDRINRGVPQHLKDGLMKRTVDNSDMERAEEVLRSNSTPEHVRKDIERLMSRGAFKPKVEDSIDENVEKEIDAYHTREVRRAIKEGRVADPSKAKDPWLQKRRAR